MGGKRYHQSSNLVLPGRTIIEPESEFIGSDMEYSSYTSTDPGGHDAKWRYGLLFYVSSDLVRSVYVCGRGARICTSFRSTASRMPHAYSTAHEYPTQPPIPICCTHLRSRALTDSRTGHASRPHIAQTSTVALCVGHLANQPLGIL